MSKYATGKKVASGASLEAQKTVNRAGGEAFKSSPELELVQLLAASGNLLHLLRRVLFRLIDAINLIHPPATKAISALMKGTLKPAETWEVKRTQTGQAAKAENLSEEDKTEALANNWRELLKEKKLGYFAAVRNVRNILKEAPDMADTLAEFLTNEKAIANSKLFPYHFLLAAKAVDATDKNGRTIVTALNKAMEISCKNIPELEGETLVVVDHSGSMTTGVAFAKGKDGSKGEQQVSLSALEAADVFAAIMVKAFNCDVVRFGNVAEYVSLNPDDSIFTIARLLKNDMGGTNFNAIFPILKKAYDRIYILSDNMSWMGYNAPVSEVKAYQRKFGKETRVCLWNLAGYETHPLPEKWFTPLAGFSANIFKLMADTEVDSRALLKEIEAVEL